MSRGWSGHRLKLAEKATGSESSRSRLGMLSWNGQMTFGTDLHHLPGNGKSGNMCLPKSDVLAISWYSYNPSSYSYCPLGLIIPCRTRLQPLIKRPIQVTSRCWLLNKLLKRCHLWIRSSSNKFYHSKDKPRWFACYLYFLWELNMYQHWHDFDNKQTWFEIDRRLS